MADEQELDDYELGYLAALWNYAWWKDGTAYVGTTGRTYAEAKASFLAERGKSA